MARQSIIRKLVAILAADVVGYSRLMEADEDTTIRMLDTYRRVIDGLVESHRGRVFGSAGDSVVAEFASPVEAVSCASNIQRELERRNADLPEDRRMQLRIGVNLGDVVVKGEDLLGDGVNVAARLQALADPGGIFLSGTVFDQVDGKLDLTFDDLGEQEVKNIAKPVRVYQVGSARTGSTADARAAKRLPLPEKPSIAVLPFTNISGDADQEYLADGMTEDIITALSKIEKMLVIARTSTFLYKGQAVDVKRISRDLSVRYVLEGSVRSSGRRIRITAQLIDATTGHHLWAERYDRQVEDIFELQDEITLQVTTALQVQLTEGEQARIWSGGTTDLEAWELTIQGVDLMQKLHAQENAHARRLFEQAVELDPNYATAWTWLGWTYWYEATFGMTEAFHASFEQARMLVEKALAIDDKSGDSLAFLSIIHLDQGEHAKAVDMIEKAVEFAPSHALAMGLSGVVLSLAGQPDRALAAIDKAKSPSGDFM